jgi:hypothetical protein
MACLVEREKSSSKLSEHALRAERDREDRGKEVANLIQ